MLTFFKQLVYDELVREQNDEKIKSNKIKQFFFLFRMWKNTKPFYSRWLTLNSNFFKCVLAKIKSSKTLTTFSYCYNWFSKLNSPPHLATKLDPLKIAGQSQLTPTSAQWSMFVFFCFVFFLHSNLIKPFRKQIMFFYSLSSEQIIFRKLYK